MKILKYIFLLIVLLSIGGSVFIATQKNNYKTKESIIINSPKSSVFSYVNDYRNWENWYVWEKDNKEIILKYSNKTSGVGAVCNWKGNNIEGKSTTTLIKGSDTIVQEIGSNGAVSETTWNFKDTIGGTKVTCISEGEMPFMFKINALLNGGIDNVIGENLKKSLVNLDRILDYELNTFKIKQNGIVVKKSVFYLHQTINSKVSKLNYNLNIIIPDLIKFSVENKLKLNGKPFIIYNSFDLKKPITNVSICLPIKDRIFTSSGSDISCDELEAFTAFKTTLIGDYSHRGEALEKSFNAILDKNEIRNKNIPLLEVLSKGLMDGKKPSEWETFIYVAIQPKNTSKAPKKLVMEENIQLSETLPQK